MSSYCINCDVEACANCEFRKGIDILFDIITDKNGNKVFSLRVGRDECMNCQTAYDYLETIE